MRSWLWMLCVIGVSTLMVWCPAEAKDRSVAKSLTRTGPILQGGYSRICANDDLLGTWRLVAFDSPYRFRNPRAPYLFPHQVFQYAEDGGAKSAHALAPIAGRPERVLEAVPSAMTYRVARGGLVILKKNGREEIAERWSCQVTMRDQAEAVHGAPVKRGDLVMMLRGTEGQTLFVRHLRKDAA